MNGIAELKSIPHWIGWKEETKPGRNKPTKTPKNPWTGGYAQSNNPETWTNVNKAWQAVKRHQWDGLGWVFTIKAGIVGIDLDNCFDDAVLQPWASDVLRMCGSYAELSPSGNGLHIFVRGTIPTSTKTAQFEMYNELRYFTVTGKPYTHQDNDTSTSYDISICENQKSLDALHVIYGEGFNRKTKAPQRNYQPSSVEAKEVARALAFVPVAQSYHDWLRCLMAVHDSFPGTDGVGLVEAWSPGYDGEVEQKFRSFERTSKGGVTIGTVFHIAQQYGYEAPRTNGGNAGRRVSRLTSQQRQQAIMTADTGGARINLHG